MQYIGILLMALLSSSEGIKLQKFDISKIKTYSLA